MLDQQMQVDNPPRRNPDTPELGRKGPRTRLHAERKTLLGRILLLLEAGSVYTLPESCIKAPSQGTGRDPAALVSQGWVEDLAQPNADPLPQLVVWLLSLVDRVELARAHRAALRTREEQRHDGDLTPVRCSKRLAVSSPLRPGSPVPLDVDGGTRSRSSAEAHDEVPAAALEEEGHQGSAGQTRWRPDREPAWEPGHQGLDESPVDEFRTDHAEPEFWLGLRRSSDLLGAVMRSLESTPADRKSVV